MLPLGFQLAAVMIFFGGLLTDKLKPKAGTPGPAAPSRLRALALLPVDYGVFCALFLLLGSDGTHFGLAWGRGAGTAGEDYREEKARQQSRMEDESWSMHKYQHIKGCSWGKVA